MRPPPENRRIASPPAPPPPRKICSSCQLEIIFLHNTIEASSSEWLTCLAMVDGRPVATCDLTQWAKEHPQIMSLCVQPEFRRRGFGSKLMQACIAKCREAGKKSVSLIVHKKNGAAEELYRTLGFRAFCESGDDVWMSIPLNQ